MLITECVEMKWNSKNKKRYEELGYIYTKMKDSFMVKVCDLPKGSGIKVEVKCDYCGKQFEVSWYHRVKSLRNINKDCCNDKKCTGEKAADVLEVKYGKRNVNQIEEFKEKTRQTNLKRYGCENVFQNQEIKEKSKKTMIEKYGVEHNTQLEEVKEKIKETCIRKYGVDNYSKTREFRERFCGENSPRWKPDKTTEERDRYTLEDREWRNEIFEKSNYTCQKCGETHTLLHAHHIYNWKTYESLRYDICNGVCLCKSCHTEFHSIYGRRNNNLMQILNFLNYGKKVC